MMTYSHLPAGVTLLPGEEPQNDECPKHSDGRHQPARLLSLTDGVLTVGCRCGFTGTVEPETALDCLSGSVEWEETSDGN